MALLAAEILDDVAEIALERTAARGVDRHLALRPAGVLLVDAAVVVEVEIDAAVIQRRDLTVVARREPLQPRFAGVDRDAAHASRAHRLQEPWQNLLRLLIVHPDPAFHRHFDARLRDHLGHAIRDQLGGFHQHRPEGTRLHTVRGAAAIQVDLVIAPIARNPHRLRQLLGIRPTQLQRHRMLGLVVIQKHLALAVDHRGRSDHLGIKQRMARQLAPQVKVNAIAPALLMFNEGDSAEYKAYTLKKSLMEIEPGPTEVLQSILYLLQSRYITGRVLALDERHDIAERLIGEAVL